MLETEVDSIVIGLDIGRKRTGIARADSTLTLASPVAVLDTEPLNTFPARLLDCLEHRRIRLLVAGLPLDRSGGEGPAAEYIREAGAGISNVIKTPIEYIDERFTTREMQVRRKEAGFKAEKQHAQIDAWAAVAILQTYLEALSNRQPNS